MSRVAALNQAEIGERLLLVNVLSNLTGYLVSVDDLLEADAVAREVIVELASSGSLSNRSGLKSPWLEDLIRLSYLHAGFLAQRT